jgi:hypothetical protein
MNVLEAEVSVAIADSVLANSPREKTAVELVELPRVVTHPLEGQTRYGVSDEGFRLTKVFVGANPQLLDTTPTRDFSRWLLRFVELREPGRNAVELWSSRRAALEQTWQEISIVEPPHLDDVLNDATVPVQRQLPRIQEDGPDSQMDV